MKALLPGRAQGNGRLTRSGAPVGQAAGFYS